MSDIYLFSGLGADKRIFKNVVFPERYRIHHIEWIAPEEGEALEKYSSRLLNQIKTPNPVLIAVSFGGLVALEVAKQIQVEKIILISSICDRRSIPFVFRVIESLKVLKFIPSDVFKIANWTTYWFFGIEKKNEIELLSSIMADSDGNFNEWAVQQLLKWKGVRISSNIVRIHGTSDRLLPSRGADILIKDGGTL